MKLDLILYFRFIMIGDRLETDIKFGVNGKIDTCLVLSGCDKLEDISKQKESENPITPTYIMPKLGTLKRS